MIRTTCGAGVLAALDRLSACGDEGNARPTKAEFVKRACTIQVVGNRKLLAAGQAATPGTSEKQFVEDRSCRSRRSP